MSVNVAAVGYWQSRRRSLVRGVIGIAQLLVVLDLTAMDGHRVGVGAARCALHDGRSTARDRGVQPGVRQHAGCALVVGAALLTQGKHVVTRVAGVAYPALAVLVIVAMATTSFSTLARVNSSTSWRSG